MSNPHEQDREWSLVQQIRELRESDPKSTKLKAAQAELVAAFNDDAKTVANQIRGRYGRQPVLMIGLEEGKEGALEDHLKTWLINWSVPRYDPRLNPSFRMWVITGWRRNMCIQEYVRESLEGLRRRRVKDKSGKVTIRFIAPYSLDGPTTGKDGDGGSYGELIEDDDDLSDPLGRLFSMERAQEIRQFLKALQDAANVEMEQLAGLLAPLTNAECKPKETDEYRRREAMLALLRDDVSCPDCSDEFQRRQWWNGLVAGSE